MRIIVLCNRSRELRPELTTWMLAERAASRGHDVFVSGVADLELTETGQVALRASRVGTDKRLATRSKHLVLVPGDLLLMRTNPGRDNRRWAQSAALEFAQMAEQQGVVVLSRPLSLFRAQSKAFLSLLPADLRPRTLVSRDPERIRNFLEQLDGPGVIKPLVGSQGRNVFRVEGPSDANLAQIVEVLGRSGYLMVQEFLPAASEGDTRAIMLEGELLEVNGKPALVRRVPEDGEFRSNVHLGAKPHPPMHLPELREMTRRVGPVLREADIFLAGVDVIGGKAVEINVFSPGGLGDAAQYAGVDFMPPIMEAMERRVSEANACRLLALEGRLAGP